MTKNEIEAKAKAAINEVISAKRGMAARAIRVEFRKAFPFGPAASAEEKRTWEKMVERAAYEIEQWPRPLAVLLALAIAISCNAAQAYPVITVDGEPWMLRGCPPAWQKELQLHLFVPFYALVG